MKHAIIVFILTIGCYAAYCQGFLKTYKITANVDHNGNCVYVDKDGFYVQVGMICPNHQECSVIEKYSFEGDLLWSKIFESIHTANESGLIRTGDTLLVSGYEAWYKPNRKFHLLMLNAENGDSLNHIEINYNAITKNGVANNGIVVNGGQAILYGETKMPDDTVSAIVQWVGLDGTIGPLKEYRYPLNYLNSAWDMEIDQDGNMVFMYTRYVKPEWNDVRVFTKINKSGNILKILDGIDYKALTSLKNNFTILKNGHYAYIFNQTGFTLAKRYARVHVCDTLGNIIWYFDFPPNFITQELINVTEISKTMDGGLVGCGYFTMPNSPTSCIIFKLSEQGVLEFVHKYSIKNEVLNNIENLFLYDVKEMPDGSFVATGNHKNGFTQPGENVLIIKTDANGCISEDDCGENIIYVTDVTEAYKIKGNSLYPNPSSDLINVEVAHAEQAKSMAVYDYLGNTIFESDEIDTENQINTANYPKGIYTLKISYKNGNTQNYKFVKVE